MRVRNIKQGTVWEVEGAHLQRLLASPDYEALEEELDDALAALTKEELVEVARERDVPVKSYWRKAQILQALRG